MGWRAARRERREEDERRRAAGQARWQLLQRMNLATVGVYAALLVVLVGASTSLPAWIIGIGAAIAATPTVVGIRQLPDAYRRLRRAKE